jgi:hypothetical protein
VNAYQDLMTALVARRPDQSAAEDDRIVQAALAKHAHELAEKIRGWAAVEVSGEIEEIYGYAADLIDPQSEDYIDAGPVRPDEEPPAAHVTLDNSAAKFTPTEPPQPHYPDEEPT